ncbi:O-antigen ligase family protein [Candidatus Poribacteria bacterium]|nr:O-antigen ligase family protein [Candidatus Poribacteria bacterium]
MTQAAPPAPAPRLFYHYPSLCLAFLLLILTISHVYPQGAYPFHGVVLGLGLVISFALSCGHHAARRWRLNGGAAGLTAAAAALLWVVWWGVRQTAAPVPALSRSEVVDIVQGGLVFLASASICLCWSSRDLGDASESPGASGAVSPDRIAALWLITLGAGLALLSLYQVLGPAGLPMTFRSQEAFIASHPEDFDPARYGGVLHALRERRASGRFGQPNLMGGFLALCLPISLALAFRSSTARGRVAGLLPSALLALCLLLTGSRGGLLAAIAGVVLFAALALWRARMSRALAATCLSLVLLGAAAPPASSNATRWLGRSTVSQRFLYWQTGWKTWSENLPFGRGPGGYAVYYTQNRLPGANETKFAHNWVVQWGSEAGAAGLLLFGAWAGASLLLGCRWWRQASRAGNGVLPAAWLAGAAALLAHGLVEFTLSFRELYLDLALCLGILAGMGSRVLAHAAPVQGRRNFRRVRLGGVMVLGVGAAAAWWYQQLRPAASEYHRDLAEAALSGEGGTPAAIAAYGRALAWQPDDANLYEARSLLRSQSGDPTGGADDLTRAIQIEPLSARLRQTMALQELEQGRIQPAIEWQREAVRLHPLDGTHRMVLAELLWRAGLPEDARKELEPVDSLLLLPPERARFEADRDLFHSRP